MKIKKYIILVGDFNIDLLHYESHTQPRDFLDCMYSGSLSQQITTPTRMTACSSKIFGKISTTKSVQPNLKKI